MASEIKHIMLCEQCIAAIRSRGEKVWVGEEIERDEDVDDEGNWFVCDDLKCEWCEQEKDELFDCHF